MKKLILVVALIFLLLTYGNYRKQQILSQHQDYNPTQNLKPKRSRALSYEEMAARNRAEEAESLLQKIDLDSTATDSTISDSLGETTIPKPDSILIDTLEIKIFPDSL